MIGREKERMYWNGDVDNCKGLVHHGLLLMELKGQYTVAGWTRSHKVLEKNKKEICKKT
jgi:hypothetical protein